MAIEFDGLGGFELRECYKFVGGVTVADVWRQLQVERIGRLRLLQGQHARVQVQISEEDHVVDHEAEERPQFILGRKHELLVLVVNDCLGLHLHILLLLSHEVGPGELLFHSVVLAPVLRLV